VHVQAPAAVRALVRDSTRRLLMPFFAGPQTVSGAARRLRQPLRSVANKVQRLVALGLLEVVPPTRPGARGVRRLQTPGEAFFIPLGAFPAELYLSQEAAYARVFTGALLTVAAQLGDGPEAPVGFRVYAARGGTEEATFTLAVNPTADLDVLAAGNPAFMTGWSTLTLRDETARALQGELLALLERYQALQHPSGAPYLTRWGLVPLR
jgi:hypothetical protein